MKRIVFILLGFGVVAFNSCTKKDDTSPPVITLKGASTMHISLNADFQDPGITVTDDIDDSDVYTTDYSALNPNTNLEGTYTINYYSTDNGGNSTHAFRTVIVSNDAKNLSGLYSVTDYVYGKSAGTYTYKVNVISSTTINNKLLLVNFGGLGGSVTVTAIAAIDTVAVKPDSQIPPGMTFSGSIKGGGDVVSGKITNLYYTINYYSGGIDHGYSYWSK